MTPQELHDDMIERCHNVWTLYRDPFPEDPTAPAKGVGALIMAPSGHLLAIEIGIDPDGAAHAVVRAIDPYGEPVKPSVLDLDDQVLISIG